MEVLSVASVAISVIPTIIVHFATKLFQRLIIEMVSGSMVIPQDFCMDNMKVYIALGHNIKSKFQTQQLLP